MTIGLLNLYSTRNLGDAAIYSALTAMAPNHRTSGVLNEVNGTAVPGLTFLPRLPDCQAYVSVGGEIFNNARRYLVTKRFLANVGELSWYAPKTMLFGQSIPESCQGPAFAMLALALRRLPAVVVRDERSHRQLRAAGVAAELSYDSAFALRPAPMDIAAAARLFDRLGLDPARTAVVSLRGHSPMYAESGKSTAHGLIALSRRLMARGHRVALVLQADNDICDSDRSLCKQIVEELPGVAVMDPFEEPAEVPPYALLMGVLALANVVVAVRYHSAILRLVAGRQAFVLHYSNKGKDLAQRLGLPGLPLSAAGDDNAVAFAERSAEGVFDAAPLTRDVREHFEGGLDRIGKRGPAAAALERSPRSRAQTTVTG